MRTLITGGRGQLGSALNQLRPWTYGVSHAELDITDPRAVYKMCERLEPKLIIHCAAWTAVDEAARRPADAHRVNSLGTYNLVMAALKHRAAFVYISTNEVFDGVKDCPYVEDDTPNPINAYGKSKFAGECHVLKHLSRFFIIRTSWLTAVKGRNFVHRVQQLADETGQLRMVTDEVASPTFVDDLAPALWRLIDTGRFGIYHLANQGICSRYDFARAILERTGRGDVPVEGITADQYQRASTPPRFSPLANRSAASLGITLPRWEVGLERFLQRSHQA